jgi:hypothetical protein
MPVRKRSIARRELTPAMHMELMTGPHNHPDFRDEDERRELYFAHRDELVSQTGKPPWGWYVYESPDGLPEPFRRSAETRARGRATTHAGGDTYADALAHWRQYFGLRT